MAKRFPVLYPMPFGEEQYRKYLELAKEPVEMEEYIQKAWNEILPENPRVCKKHADKGLEMPLESCADCMRYNKNMIEKTVDNLVRCGFLKKIGGYVCHKHNRKKKGKLPKPVEDCPDCKPYKGRVCNFHKEMGVEEPDSNCSDCKEGYISLEVYPKGKKWLNGELKGGFSQLVFESLKIGWGHQLRLPRAIDAALDILSEFNSLKLNETLSGTEIQESLTFQQKNEDDETKDRENLIYRKKGGYDFNYAKGGGRRSVREILKLLVHMEALENDKPNSYSNGEKFESRKEGLKNVDMLSNVEKIISDYGPNAQILQDKERDIALKALISKYYIYVQCGGIGKDQWFLRKIHKALFATTKGYPIELSTGRKTLIPAHKIANERALLRERIAKKWKLTKEEFKHRTIDSLRDIERAHSEDEMFFLLDSYSSKFNRSILDRLCHDNGLFSFPNNFKPYRWQNEAVAKWISGEGKEKHEPFHGIVSVVTGAGKTPMAFLAIKEYLNRFPDAKVSVVVPTRVLMYQWARELSRILAIPATQIGFRGDDFKDSFNDDRKIMILVVNSAIQDNFLRDNVSNLNNQIKHFLIADECHRYTGEKFQKIFECRRDATLGLSATPIERENIPEKPSDTLDSDHSILIKELGPIYYELNYRQALKENLISEFTVNYIGVELTPTERSEYDNYTKKLSKVLEKIRLRYGNRLDIMSGTSLDQKLQVILKTDENPDGAIGQYFKLVRERRNILYDAMNRKGAYFHLLNRAIEDNRKAIVFHEKIDQLEEIVAPMEHRKFIGKGLEEIHRSDYEKKVDQELEDLLYKDSYRPVMYHSGHEKEFWNQWAMDWFRNDTANIMLSVKALIEGVDVPAADVGIVRVSSSSVRQRIQATGRILRKLKEGKEKHSHMYIIFVRNTVDENIFKKYDWQRELGSSEIKYYYWHPNIDNPTMGELEEEKDLRLLPIKEEYEDNRPPIEVDVSGLEPGAKYLGRFVGDMYHVTAEGKPYRRSIEGRIFIETEEMVKAGQMIRDMKGGGKLLVTPQGNMVTNVKGKGTVYLGTVDISTVRNEVSLKSLSINRSRKEKFSLEKTPTFEELFGSGG